MIFLNQSDAISIKTNVNYHANIELYALVLPLPYPEHTVTMIKHSHLWDYHRTSVIMITINDYSETQAKRAHFVIELPIIKLYNHLRALPQNPQLHIDHFLMAQQRDS